MNMKENENAVSPVIGVILMVAITVILAAVIAAFVFGMAGNIPKTKIVAATATQQGNTIYVTYQGGPDAPTVTTLTATINGTSKTFTSPPTVGESVSDNTAGKITAGQDHVIVVAAFGDSTSQVILDTYV